LFARPPARRSPSIARVPGVLSAGRKRFKAGPVVLQVAKDLDLASAVTAAQEGNYLGTHDALRIYGVRLCQLTARWFR